MPTSLPHTGLLVPDDAPRVVALTVADGQVEAEVTDDHRTLGHIVGNARDGRAFNPTHPAAVMIMGRFMKETEQINSGPVITSSLLTLMIDEYFWQCQIDDAHHDEKYLVRYIGSDFTRDTWRLTPDTTYPDYAACVRLLLENPHGWAQDVLEAEVWAGHEDGWVTVYSPAEPPQQ